MSDYGDYLRNALIRHYETLCPEASPQEAEEAAQRILDEYERPLADRIKYQHVAGLSHRDIAAICQCHRNTVGRTLTPEVREKYNLYLREYMRELRARKRAE